MKAEQTWDAGALGCGELLIELKRRLASLEGGQLFRLIAQDPGAVEDLPAWCKLTGHTLIEADRPTYLIRVRAKG